MASVIEAAKGAKAATAALARMSSEKKTRALMTIAREVEANAKEIFDANRKDLDAAKPLVESGQMAQSLYRRLKIDEAKLGSIAEGIAQVAALEDPVGKVTLATELDEGLRLYRVNCPIGVVGVIFESRPDALAQISALCLKSSNAVLLKGGREAEHSNRALFNVIQSAAAGEGLPAAAMVLLESREDVSEMLKAGGYVDLIIPRGSNALVSYVQKNTAIPVLGHAEGICHIYVDRAADLDKAFAVVMDAKLDYPAACNAVETLLVHTHVAREFLPRIITGLQERGVEVRCDERSLQEYEIKHATKASVEDWETEYCDLILSVKVVDKIEDAIEHINAFGSHHTEAIITEDATRFDRFFAAVDSAGIYQNASTRFADGYRYGFGAEVGISTGKMHPRGPVGLEGLVTYKYKLTGSGHTAGMYSGSNGRQFAHKPIK